MNTPTSAAEDYADAIAASLPPDWRPTCAFKGCKLPLTAPAATMFRRDLYCTTHQVVFRVTKKLANHGYGAQSYVRPIQQQYGLGAGPKTPVAARGRAGRPSMKGIWAAAEQVLANARREVFRRQQVAAAKQGRLAEDGAILVPAHMTADSEAA